MKNTQKTTPTLAPATSTFDWKAVKREDLGGMPQQLVDQLPRVRELVTAQQHLQQDYIVLVRSVQAYQKNAQSIVNGIENLGAVKTIIEATPQSEFARRVLLGAQAPRNEA